MYITGYQRTYKTLCTHTQNVTEQAGYALL